MDVALALPEVFGLAAVPDGRHLGRDRLCDVERRPATEVEAGRRVDPLQFRVGELPTLRATLLADLLEALPRAEQADVWDR